MEKMAKNSQFIGELQHRTEDYGKGIINEACMRSALLYEAETWAPISRLVVLRRCDRRMLRYMEEVRWQVKTENLAVRQQRCMELKTFLLS